METKHTPGPWQHDGDGDYVSVDMNASKMICDIRGWGWLQKMGEKKARETQIANGKLIAAAPIMYAYIARQSDNGDVEAAKIIESIL